jgi:serine/threonine protein kinase
MANSQWARLSFKLDIFALGRVMLWLLAGELRQYFYNHITEIIELQNPALKRVLEGMLHKDPERRWTLEQVMQEWLDNEKAIIGDSMFDRLMEVADETLGSDTPGG